MGLDAPSTDLTGRIRALRKAGVANGDIEPALPGEHALHGRGGVDVERLSAAHAARDRRAARTEVAGGDQVVDFEYLPGEEEALRLSAEDGGEGLGTPEASAEDTLEDPVAVAEAAALPDEVDEPAFDLGGSPEQISYEPDPAQSDAVQAEILERVEAVHTRLDGQDAATLLLAEAIMGVQTGLAALHPMIHVLLLDRPVKKIGLFARLLRWLRTLR